MKQLMLVTFKVGQVVYLFLLSNVQCVAHLIGIMQQPQKRDNLTSNILLPGPK